MRGAALMDAIRWRQRHSVVLAAHRSAFCRGLSHAPEQLVIRQINDAIGECLKHLPDAQNNADRQRRAGRQIFALRRQLARVRRRKAHLETKGKT